MGYNQYDIITIQYNRQYVNVGEIVMNQLFPIVPGVKKHSKQILITMWVKVILWMFNLVQSIIHL